MPIERERHYENIYFEKDTQRHNDYRNECLADNYIPAKCYCLKDRSFETYDEYEKLLREIKEYFDEDMPYGYFTQILYGWYMLKNVEDDASFAEVVDICDELLEINCEKDPLELVSGAKNLLAFRLGQEMENRGRIRKAIKCYKTAAKEFAIGDNIDGYIFTDVDDIMSALYVNSRTDPEYSSLIDDEIIFNYSK